MTAQHRADIGSPARTRQADRSGGRAATRGAEREQARASRRRRRVALGLTTGLMSVVTLSASLASTLGGGETATAVAVQDASSARSY